MFNKISLAVVAICVGAVFRICGCKPAATEQLTEATRELVRTEALCSGKRALLRGLSGRGRG